MSGKSTYTQAQQTEYRGEDAPSPQAAMDEPSHTPSSIINELFFQACLTDTCFRGWAAETSGAL